jgi:hypothetical protein
MTMYASSSILETPKPTTSAARQTDSRRRRAPHRTTPQHTHRHRHHHDHHRARNQLRRTGRDRAQPALVQREGDQTLADGEQHEAGRPGECARHQRVDAALASAAAVLRSSRAHDAQPSTSHEPSTRSHTIRPVIRLPDRTSSLRDVCGRATNEFHELLYIHLRESGSSSRPIVRRWKRAVGHHRRCNDGRVGRRRVSGSVRFMGGG